MIHPHRDISPSCAERVLPSPLGAAAATGKAHVLKWILGFLDSFGLRYPTHSRQFPWAIRPQLAEWRTAYTLYVCRIILSAIPCRQSKTENILMEHFFNVQGSGDEVVEQEQVNRPHNETGFLTNAVYVDERDATSGSDPDRSLNTIGDPVGTVQLPGMSRYCTSTIGLSRGAASDR